jgi:tRNA threonylcarbamoyladenosine biosynthesis protein TsaE
LDTFHTSSPEETREVGRKIAGSLNSGDVILLTGELGSGKTTFVKGLVDGMGITIPVKSPTFNIINIYKGNLILYHIDLYRLESKSELDDIGLYSYLYSGNSICVIEWGERLENFLTDSYISIRFLYNNGDRRKIEISRIHPKAVDKDSR